MTIVDAINAITDWLNENVCPKLLFKKADDRNVADSYTLREVHPTAYAMFYPNDLIPEEKRGDPFIVVTPSKGKRDTVSKAERLTVQLSFRTWNPGTHAAESAGKAFAPSTGGWTDVWNLLDWTLREIENEQYINGLRFVASDGAEFGPIAKDGQFIDEYPYFTAYATLTFERPIVRKDSAFAEML